MLSEERILDGDGTELLIVLEVFRVEKLAAGMLRSGDDEAVVPAQAVAVSYTHLDVYKRQAVGNNL